MEGFAAIGSHGAPERERRATHGHVRDGAMHGAESALGVCVVVWYDRWKVPKVQDCSMHLHVSHTGTSCCLARCQNVHDSSDAVEGFHDAAERDGSSVRRDIAAGHSGVGLGLEKFSLAPRHLEQRLKKTPGAASRAAHKCCGTPKPLHRGLERPR